MAAAKNSDSGKALGLLETQGLVAALEGADAMLKAARVELVSQERTVPGLITSKIVGETAAVRSAIDAGRAAAERVGEVVSSHVIPRPASEIRETLGLDQAALLGKSTRSILPKEADWSSMTVTELRKQARARNDESFSGRTISKASKAQLIAFLQG